MRGMDPEKGQAMGLQLSLSPKLQIHLSNHNLLVIALGTGSRSTGIPVTQLSIQPEVSTARCPRKPSRERLVGSKGKVSITPLRACTQESAASFEPGSIQGKHYTLVFTAFVATFAFFHGYPPIHPK